MFKTPKIDWKTEDYFNIEDYNRIKNNLAYLKEYSLELYNEYEIKDMGSDVTYSDLPYAEMINAIEDNLETIAKNTVNVDIGETRNYSDNDYFPNFEEINRIESGILKIYNYLYGQYHGRNKLRFKLNMKGVL